MVREKHPPKKKHINRPRKDPISPLSQAERAFKAQHEFDKAIIHLSEAEKMAAWGDAPNACVHSAYYAMYHAASAAILANGGVGKRQDVPASHEHVVEHYGKAVADKGNAFVATGQHLNRARTDRMVADYDLAGGASLQDATEATRHARSMVDLIKGHWGFGDEVRSDRDR